MTVGSNRLKPDFSDTVSSRYGAEKFLSEHAKRIDALHKVTSLRSVRTQTVTYPSLLSNRKFGTVYRPQVLEQAPTITKPPDLKDVDLDFYRKFYD